MAAYIDDKLTVLIRRLTDVYAIGKDTAGSWLPGSWSMKADAKRRCVAVITEIMDSEYYEPRMAVTKLVSMLGDKDAFVRLWSLEALFTFTADAPINTFITPVRGLFTDQYWRVRRRAMQLAGESAQMPEVLCVLQDLRSAIGDGPEGRAVFEDNADVRRAAVEVMGTLSGRGCHEASATILAAAKNVDADVRRAAIEAICIHLGEFSYPHEAHQALIAGLKDDDGIVRVQAVNAQVVLMSDGDLMAKKRILDALADEDNRVCAAAELALCGPRIDTNKATEPPATVDFQHSRNPSTITEPPRAIIEPPMPLPVPPPANAGQIAEKALAREIDRLALAARAICRMRDEDAASSSSTNRRLEDASASMEALRVELGILRSELVEKVGDVLSGVDLTPGLKSTPGTMTPASAAYDFELEQLRRERDEAQLKLKTITFERDDATHKLKTLAFERDNASSKLMELAREKEEKVAELATKLAAAELELKMSIEELADCRDEADNKILNLERDLEELQRVRSDAVQKDVALSEVERMQAERENDVVELQRLREECVRQRQEEVQAIICEKEEMAYALEVTKKEVMVAKTERDEANLRAQALQNKMDELVAKAQSSYRRLQSTPTKSDPSLRRSKTDTTGLRTPSSAKGLTPASSPGASPAPSPPRRWSPSPTIERLPNAGDRRASGSPSRPSPKRAQRSSQSPSGTPPTVAETPGQAGTPPVPGPAISVDGYRKQ